MYCNIKNVSDNDLIFNYDGFSLYVNKNDYVYLKNANINLKKKNTISQLVLDVPNIFSNKYYKNFSKEEKIKFWIKNEINTNLSIHGGSIKFVKVDKYNYVHLKFLGSCNGCNMSNITLKNFVEKRLLKKFPKIKGIKDITEHIHGIHSYY
ncbi:NifU family protein [Buchnera aphidicola]|uniref:NifU family protein n=1 Tax=Buchnera aphidicola TaxID=9 RepID=UPI0031B8469D